MYLFGASGHGKVIADIIISSTDKKIDAFIDDNPTETLLLDIPVFNTQNIILNEKDDCIICVGDNKTRQKISERLNVNFINAIHNKSTVSNFSMIGNGTVVMAGSVINADVIIGKHCIVNTCSVIEHDCIIEDFVHISPNAALAGNVSIGIGSHIGIGACVIQGVKIGKWVTIGAGAVILNDIPNFATVVGNPGRIIKIHQK